jgi:hypothetical protein
MGKKKKKDKKIIKPKPKCCGKFRKKNKHCSRCPVLFREQCKLDTERSEMGKKKEDKKKAKKKVDNKKNNKKKGKKKK